MQASDNLFYVDNYVGQLVIDENVGKIADLAAQTFLEDNLLSEFDVKFLGLDYEQAYTYYYQIIKQQQKEKRALQIVERDDFSVIVGFTYSSCMTQSSSSVLMPRGWQAASLLDMTLKERFIKKYNLTDFSEYEYIDGGFSIKESRGKNVPARVIICQIEYLKKNFGKTHFVTPISGPYTLKGLLREGFRLIDQLPYSEFEFEGFKIYKDVKSNNYYKDGIPASYLLYYRFGGDSKL